MGCLEPSSITEHGPLPGTVEDLGVVENSFIYFNS